MEILDLKRLKLRYLEEKYLDVCRRNPIAGVDYILSWNNPGWLGLAWFHKEWIRAYWRALNDMYRVRNGEISADDAKTRIVIETSRGHAKTTVVLGFLLWALGKDPDLTIKIVSNSDEQSWKKVDFMKQQIEKNENLHKLFPELQPASKVENWSKTRFIVKRSLISPDPTVEGYGIKTSSVGSHGWIGVFDDVQDDKTTLQNPAENEKIKQIFFNAWYPIIEPGGIIIYVGCLPRGTKVLMGDGSWKDITEVEMGDEIYSYFNGELVRDKVASLHIYGEFPVYKIKTKHGTIRATKNHPFLVLDFEAESPIWKMVQELKKGDWVVRFCHVPFGGQFDASDFVLEKIESVEADGSEVVYDIETLTYQNFIADGFVVHNTPWIKGDLLDDLKTNHSDEFQIYRYAISKDLTPIWPERYTKRMLEALRMEMGDRAFARAYLCEPFDPEETMFSPELVEAAFRKGRELDIDYGKRIEEARYFCGVDLSSRLTRGHSRTCVFTIGVLEDGTRFVAEVIVGRFTSPDTARLIVDRYNYWKHDVIFVENNSYQEALLQWLKDLGYSELPLKGIYTGEKKYSDRLGVPSLAIELQQGLWAFPPNDHSSSCTCGYCEFLRELRDYPMGKTDDTIMAWMFAKEAYKRTTELGGFSGSPLRVYEFSYDEDGELEDIYEVGT